MKVIGKAMNIPKRDPQNVSYRPCNTAGIVIARKYSESLYLGYNFANAIK